MFEEMALAGLPEPELKQTESGFRVTLYNASVSERLFVERLLAATPARFGRVIERLLSGDEVTTAAAAEMTGFSKQYVRSRMQALESVGFVRRVGRSANDPLSYWELSIPLRARWRVPPQ